MQAYIWNVGCANGKKPLLKSRVALEDLDASPSSKFCSNNTSDAFMIWRMNEAPVPYIKGESPPNFSKKPKI